MDERNDYNSIPSDEWFSVPPPLDGNHPIFNQQENYVSNLPIERVKHIREIAERCLFDAHSPRENFLLEFIIELTETNK